jgi:hypothetical protein
MTNNNATQLVKGVSSRGLVRLRQNTLYIEYYQSEEYRKIYNATSDISEYMRVQDRGISPFLERIGVDAFRDKVMLNNT